MNIMEVNITIDVDRFHQGTKFGSGQAKPIIAKVRSILKCPIPTAKADITRLLRLVGYRRRFCQTFPDIVAPLTDLLNKSVKFEWTADCQVVLPVVILIFLLYITLVQCLKRAQLLKFLN